VQLICYLSNGFPSFDRSLDLAAQYVSAGCDTIEIDLPARHPFLENELIQNRMATVLRACDDYGQYLANIAEIRHRLPGTRVLLVVYEATVEEIGRERFIEFCRSNGLLDVILVGSAGEDVKRMLMQSGIRISCYVRAWMSTDEIASAVASNGFVYLQYAAADVNPEYPTLRSRIDALRSRGVDRPIYCGVGVYGSADYQAVSDAGGDGAFVGSTILKLWDQPDQLRQAIASFKA